MSAAEAIVILGARVRDGAVSRTLEARLRAGAEALRQGRAPRIIVSGRGEAEIMQRWLIDEGLPASAITLEPLARSTLENARYASALLARAAPVLVVTQPSHQPRALAVFRRLGHPAERIDAEEAWTRVQRVRERLSFLYYRLRRWG